MSVRSPETPESEPPPKTVVPHVLCDCCSRIVKKSKIIQAFPAGRGIEYMPSSSKWFLHNRSFDYVSKSSTAGCHLCSLAVAQFDLDHEENYQSFVSVKVILLNSTFGVPLRLGTIIEFHPACLKVTDQLTKHVMDDFDSMDALPRTPDFNPGGYSTVLRLMRVVSEGAVNTFQPR